MQSNDAATGEIETDPGPRGMNRVRRALSVACLIALTAVTFPSSAHAVGNDGQNPNGCSGSNRNSTPIMSGSFVKGVTQDRRSTTTNTSSICYKIDWARVCGVSGTAVIQETITRFGPTVGQQTYAGGTLGDCSGYASMVVQHFSGGLSTTGCPCNFSVNGGVQINGGGSKYSSISFSVPA
jgi:hypothetical protein